MCTPSKENLDPEFLWNSFKSSGMEYRDEPRWCLLKRDIFAHVSRYTWLKGVGTGITLYSEHLSYIDLPKISQ